MGRSTSRISNFFHSSDGRIYDGWKTVASAALVTFIAVGSVVYGFGAILEPLRTELAWSTFVVSLGFGLRSEVGGLAAPLVGMALDQVGPRTVARFGIALSAAGVLALSFTHTLWVFFPAMVMIALGSTAAGGQVGHHAVASWFKVKRGRAMSLMTVGGAAGSLTAVVVASGVDQLGWRATLRWLALVMVLVGIAGSGKMMARPPNHPQPIDGIDLPPGEAARRAVEWNVPFSDAVRSVTFRRILWFNLSADFGRLAYLVHLVAFVERDLGASGVGAGVALTVSGVGSLTGRLAAGGFIDRFPVQRVAALSMLPFVAGTAVLAVAVEPWHAYVAALVSGVGFGASIPVRPAMYVDFFGLEAFGRIMGAGRLASTTAGFLGATLVGALVDWNDGSYGLGWTLVTLVVLVSIPLMAAVSPPVDLQRRFASG